MAKKPTRQQQIARQVRQLQKRGYSTPAVSALSEYLPKDYTIKDIYALSTYRSPITGQTISGLERRTQERSIAAKYGSSKRQQILSQAAQTGKPPASEVDNVLNEIEHKISAWQPLQQWTRTSKSGKTSDTFVKVKERDKNKLEAFLNAAIQQEGREVVATRLQKRASMVELYVNQILYGGSGNKLDSSVISGTNTYMQAELNSLLEIVLGRKLDQKDAEYFTDLAEAQLPYGEDS